jgi:hypothetical protein
MSVRRRASSAWGAARRLRGPAARLWSRGRPAWLKGWSWAYGAVIFLAALVTVLALAPSEVGSAWKSAFGGGDPAGSWGTLLVERPVVLKDTEPRRILVGGQLKWVRSTLPQIDFTVRNEGENRVPLGRVRIEVTDSSRISACEPPQGGEGGIPVAQSFFVNLPFLPLPGERVVYRQLHQEVLPGRAARIRLYLRSVGDGSMDHSFADDLFAVDVSLLGDQAEHELEVGRFVLGLPKAVPRGGSFLPEATDALQASAHLHALLPSTWCFRRNLAVVRRFLSLPGERTPAMQALSLVRPPPDWRRFVDHRGAARAAGQLLLGGEFGDFFLEPVLAVYAAQQTGKQELVASTRRRAIADLRGSVEASLDEKSQFLLDEGEVDARLLSSLEPSRQNRLLLERTEAMVWESEDAAGEGGS